MRDDPIYYPIYITNHTFTNDMLYWLVAGGLIVAVEINGLIGPGAASQKPLTTVSGTIHGGLALWLVLYLVGAFLNS